jgi:hypothetical protein
MNPEMPTEPMHDPLAELERELVTAFVKGAGHDLQDLLSRGDPEARGILKEASLYASTRLSEVEGRLHYLRSLRGQV